MPMIGIGLTKEVICQKMLGVMFLQKAGVLLNVFNNQYSIDTWGKYKTFMNGAKSFLAKEGNGYFMLCHDFSP